MVFFHKHADAAKRFSEHDLWFAFQQFYISIKLNDVSFIFASMVVEEFDITEVLESNND